MNLSIYKRVLIGALLLGCHMIAWTAAAAVPTTAAKIAPADSGVFIEMRNLSELRLQVEKDPLFTVASNLVPIQEGWQQLQKMMQMTGPQLIDKYLGKTVALIGQKPQNDARFVVVTRVLPADAQALVKKMQMEKRSERGEFVAYLSQDKQAYVVVGGGWIFFADGRHGDYLESVVTAIGKGQSLADDAEFKKWTSRLDSKRSFTAFARSPQQKEIHALSITFDNLDMDIRYAGHSPFFQPILTRLGKATAVDFGPLPAGAFAAISINSRPLDTDDTTAVDQVVSRFLPPKTFKEDLLPNLHAPLVAFAGQVKPSQAEPDVPAVGLAVKLTGSADQIANDLTTLIDKLVTGAQWATIQWKTSPIIMQQARYGDTPYKTANMGKALAERTKQTHLKHVNLSYGRVGKWFVITSHERFFQQSVDAAESGKPISARNEFTDLNFDEHEQPLMTGFVRPQKLGGQMPTLLSGFPDV